MWCIVLGDGTQAKPVPRFDASAVTDAKSFLEALSRTQLGEEFAGWYVSEGYYTGVA